MLFEIDRFGQASELISIFYTRLIFNSSTLGVCEIAVPEKSHFFYDSEHYKIEFSIVILKIHPSRVIQLQSA